MSTVSIFSFLPSVSGLVMNHNIVYNQMQNINCAYVLMTAIGVGVRAFQELALEEVNMLCPILVGSESLIPPGLLECAHV